MTISMWLHGRSEQCVSPPQHCVSTQTQNKKKALSATIMPKKGSKTNKQSNLVFSCVAYLDRKNYWREFLILHFYKGPKYNVAVLVWVAFASLRFLLLHLL